MTTLALVTVALAGCGAGPGGHSTLTPARADAFGDPYITDTQGRAIKIGAGAGEVFRALGGKAASGANGMQAPFPHSFDYPIRGTGTGDAGGATNDSYKWWQICVSQRGQVVSKQRGPLGSLPTFCPGS